MRHVCIVVDNPLRDLDGAVLLARQLTASGYKATLVPMYDQGFVIPALKPDMVVLNYFRKNNLELVRLYKKLGIVVAVVDTEGLTASPEHYAQLIHSVGSMELVDLYCVWGRGQYEAVRACGELADSRLVLTGCQRNDFASYPWRAALRSHREADYVLINTNFPVANPRFSAGQSAEIETMLGNNVKRSFAEQFVRDNVEVCEKVKSTIARLAHDFPHQRFVLRPHPFERLEGYVELSQLNNVEVIQEGTSFEWLACAKLLLHLNCSTAIEATMLGVPALSLEWLNKDTLRLKTAGDVSTPLSSYADLADAIRHSIAGLAFAPPSKETLQKIEDSYHLIDGRASERICSAIQRCFEANVEKLSQPLKSCKRGFRAKVIHALRLLIGLNGAVKVQQLIFRRKYAEKRESKKLDPGVVRDILDRLHNAAPLEYQLSAERLPIDGWFRKHIAGDVAIAVQWSK